MLKMRIKGDIFMKQENVRSRLIENTVRIIADYGLDKTTTKAIVSGTDINESYIYSHFSDKEDLFIKVFDTLDSDFAELISSHVSVIYMTSMDCEMRYRVFFYKVWNYLIENREKCITYLRYYYSPYFERYSIDTHKKRYLSVVDAFKDAFIDEADVWMILNHILNVVFDFAVKVHNRQMPDSEEYSEHVFRVVYRSLEQYMNLNNI